jgi:hypothetical protein
MGHGGFDPASTGGRLLLENPDGSLYPESADVFAAWISDSPLRLVFLNACQTGRTPERSEVPPFGGVAASLIRQGVPAVVGNQFSVGDDAAISFASTFYERIAQGHPVDEAVASARKILFDETMPLQWATPVLYMRSTDGDLFGRRDMPAADSATASAAAPSAASAPVAPTPQPELVRTMSDPSNRSINISGTNTSGNVFNTGDNSTITSNITTNMGNLPPPESVDMKEVMAQLRALVDQIDDAKQKAIATNALNTADIEVKDAKPDKQNAADSLTQAVRIIKSSESFGAKAEDLAPLVMKAAAWLTPNVAVPLLKLLAPVAFGG